MALTNINDNFQLDAPKHLDNRTGNYASVAAANAAIPEPFRVQGLEVVVITAGQAVKYYYRDGVADEDLVIMPTGGGGGVPYSGATQDLNLGSHDLYANKVFLYDEPNDNYGSIHYTDGDFHIEDADGHKLLVIEDGFMQLHLSDTIQSNLFTTNLTQTRDHYLPNQSGIIALTNDITKSAVGLANVDNTSDANKPISSATQTALDNRSVSIASAGSVSITIAATGAANLQSLSGHSFTINEALMPVGATITINGFVERPTGGSGIGGLSYDVNGVKRYYTTPSGHQYQYQFTLYRESSTAIRMMGGSSGAIMAGTFASVNIASTTAAVTAGGNIVFQLFGYGSVINDVIAYRFFKAVLTR